VQKRPKRRKLQQKQFNASVLMRELIIKKAAFEAAFFVRVHFSIFYRHHAANLLKALSDAKTQPSRLAHVSYLFCHSERLSKESTGNSNRHENKSFSITKEPCHSELLSEESTGLHTSRCRHMPAEWMLRKAQHDIRTGNFPERRAIRMPLFRFTQGLSLPNLSF